MTFKAPPSEVVRPIDCSPGAGLEILDWAVLRVAAWPIETVDRFAAPRLAELAAAALAAERDIDERRPETVAALHDAVAHTAERGARAWLLAVKRTVFAGSACLSPRPPPGVALPPVVARLVDEERSARQALADRRADVEEAFTAELARQRAVLVELTDDPRFARALSVANPEVAPRWRGPQRTAPMRARDLRLEATVFHFLMRAAGRATPNGAWAGVTPVGPVPDGDGDGREAGAPRLEVAPAPGRMVASVDLTPFAAAVAARLRFPRAPASVADAFQAVGDLLVEPDRAVWDSVCGRVLDITRRLGVSFDKLSVGDLGAARRAVGRELDRLWAPGSAPLSPPVLHVDSRAPFRVAWNQAFRDWVGAAASEVLGFHRAEGVCERFRLECLQRAGAEGPDLDDSGLMPVLASFGQRLAGSGGSPGPSTWRAVLDGRRRQWEADLEPYRHERVRSIAPLDTAGPPAGPAGALVLTVAGDELWAQWGRPQPALFSSRFGEVLSEPGAADAAAAVAAVGERMAGWHVRGVAPIEIVGEDPVSVNTAIRPSAADRLDPHGERLDDFEVHIQDGRAWLRRTSERDWWLVPVYGSAAAIGTEDPRSRILLAMAMSHGWELVAMGFPLLPSEGHGWDHLPRLVLPGGTVLSPERWTLDRPAVTALAAAAPGPAAYLAWRREVERLGLPDLVWVGVAGDPDYPRLPLRVDSPLAVGCLLRRLARSPAALVFTEPSGNPATWPVCDESGDHYLAELAVSWFDDGYWDTVLPTL